MVFRPGLKLNNFLGEESVTRGCTTKSDQLPLICPAPSFSNHRKRQTGGQYQIDCCYGDFCNSGSFPELPLYTETFAYGNSMDYLLQILGAVLGSIFIIGVLGI